MALKIRVMIETYGIDPGRLEAEGFGESRPVADDSTGRENSRTAGWNLYDSPVLGAKHDG